MPKYHFNEVEIRLRYGCSPVNLLHIFRTPFNKNTPGWLLLHRVFCDTRAKGHKNLSKKYGNLEGMC